MFSDNEPSQSSSSLVISVINVKEDAFLMVILLIYQENFFREIIYIYYHRSVCVVYFVLE